MQITPLQALMNLHAAIGNLSLRREEHQFLDSCAAFLKPIVEAAEKAAQEAKDAVQSEAKKVEEVLERIDA